MIFGLTVLSVLCIAFSIGWYTEKQIIAVMPVIVCTTGLLLYLLAFFHRMSWIDGLIWAGGIASLAAIGHRAKRHGRRALLAEVRRQLGDTHLWVCGLLILLAFWMLRGEMVLEWDGYSFWGPDTKSLYFNDGFAAQYGNVAPKFGAYTPFAQLIWWLGPHFAGQYNEQYVFWGYYAFGAVLLFSLADRFRAPAGRWYAPLVSVVACTGAVLLPGIACTAWYRAIYVDPLMAMLFGLVISLIVCRDREHPVFWQVQLVVLLLSLTLIKSIGLLWSLLALLFYCMWWRGKLRRWRFVLGCAAGAGVAYASWSVFCRVMVRSSELVTNFFPQAAANRLAELQNGTFLQAGNNLGYIKSYIKAFLFTPIHRETTMALDLSPAMLLVILCVAIVLLGRYGFVPRGKGARLFGFMAVCVVLIYVVLFIGQITMFYTETQYLNPVSAVTLMTRYCAPAHMGLLMLLVTFASGKATNAEPAPPSGRQLTAAVAAGAMVFSCAAYAEMGRRFVYDPLDASRVEKRMDFTARYGAFLDAIAQVPYQQPGNRVLLCLYNDEFNPVVINEASPVSFVNITLPDDPQQALNQIDVSLQGVHAGYLYLKGLPDGLAELLTARMADGSTPQEECLYAVSENGDLQPVQ